jgi:nitrate/nitrite transporter NarK
MFGYFGLLGCFFSPKNLGSSILLLTSIQDVFWFFIIVFGGGYTFAETLGVKNAIHKLKEKKREIDAKREQHKVQRQEQGKQDEKRGHEGGRERAGGK